MMLTIDARLASEIVERTAGVLQFDVNVMDARGIVLASTDRDRAGTLHPGAQLALTHQRDIEIDAAMAARMPGVKPGINLPLSVDGRLCGVIGITGAPDEVRYLGHLLRVTAEMILQRDLLMTELRHSTRNREAFVLQSIDSERTTSKQDLTAWAVRLGVDTGLARAAIICRLQADDIGTEHALAEIERIQMRLAEAHPQLLTARTSHRELVIFDLLDPRGTARDSHAALAKKALKRLSAELSAMSSSPFVLALGIAMIGIEGFARSWQSAITTMEVGLRVPRPPEAGLSYYDFSLPVLLSGMTTSWQAQQLLAPLEYLLAHKRGADRLLDTLTLWYANDGNPGATADALGVHRNTLDYRLRRIGAITGLNLASFDDRVQLYIALQLRKS